MQVTQTSFTIAEYCDQMQSGSIIVNKEYQRSSRVWPPAARSFLIDTILRGYPVPKFSLYQKTDVKSRKTVKEIVDGQQRSMAISDFFNDRMKISGKGEYSGLTYAQLDETGKQQFLSYSLSADIFVGATDEDIREVFRRINSYTVPLNPQEKRHAVYQGEFKWFIWRQCQKYSQAMKNVGILSESQISRMADAALLTEICVAVVEGHQNASEKKNEDFYRKRDQVFPEHDEMEERLRATLSRIISWQSIHNTSLMKPYNAYSLMLAIMHKIRPIPSLLQNGPPPIDPQFVSDIVLSNFGKMADALEGDRPAPELQEFVEACSKATNRINSRRIRFLWFCRALEPKLI